MSDPEPTRPAVPVADLLAAGPADLGLRLLAGAGGLHRLLVDPAVGLAGLALAGPPEGLPEGAALVLGRVETAWIRTCDPADRAARLDALARSRVACLVLAQGDEPVPDLVRACDARALPLLSSQRPAGAVVDRLGRHLEERLAPALRVHGTLIDIFGVGVLILGASGVGKSESALELVLRGHRLVSDDVVVVRRIGAVLNGTGPEVSRYHMEIRGIGLINIEELYGVTAVRERKDIDLVVELDPWQEGKAYDRLGLDGRTHALLGIDRPYIEMPVGPGRNLSVLLEVAARHHLLRSRGHHPARELDGRIRAAMGKKG